MSTTLNDPNPLSTEQTTEVLKKHFALLYAKMAANQFIPEAAFESFPGFQRCLSGIPSHLFNAIIGIPERDQEEFLENCINEHLNYYRQVQIPFIWYLDENANHNFIKKLTHHGFQYVGIFQGVMGSIDHFVPDLQLASDCLYELVHEEKAMHEFNTLVCATFNIHGKAQDLYKQALWNATLDKQHPMFHWIMRKQGKVISAVSTLIENDLVSFWNGATLPDYRKQGMCTTLAQIALKSAVSQGCRIGMSYLMSEGLAFGICQKLGFKSQWRFHAFMSPLSYNQSE